MSKHFSIRLPEDLEAVLEHEATASGKSKSTLVVERLRESFGLIEQASPSYASRLEELEKK
jgi:predicted DNA-binding protein